MPHKIKKYVFLRMVVRRRQINLVVSSPGSSFFRNIRLPCFQPSQAFFLTLDNGHVIKNKVFQYMPGIPD
jgi:hypothetical protein